MKMTELTNHNHKDAKDLIQGLLFNFLGMLTKLSKALFVFVVAKFYGVEALGLYFLAWSVVDISSKFGLWGMDRSLVRDIARFNTDRSPKTNQYILNLIYFSIRFALFSSVVVTAIIFFVSSFIATTIFKEVNLITPLRVLSFAIPFVVLTQLFIATTKGLRLMQYEVLVRQGIEPMVLLIGAVVFIPLGLGVTALVMAHVFASFVSAISAFIVVLRKYNYLRWNPQPLERKLKKETLQFAYPIAAMDFLDLLNARTDIMLVGAFMNSVSAGLYAIVVEIISIIKTVFLGLEPVFAPIVSELFHSNQKNRLQRNYVLVTKWLMAGSFLPVIAMVIFPNQILALFNVHSIQASQSLIVLALAYGLFGTFSGSQSIMIMTGKTSKNALLGLMALVVNVTLNAFLIPKLGLVGAAIGTFTAFAVVITARIYHVYNKLGLLPFSLSLFWPIATAVFTGTMFYLLKVWLNIDTVFEVATVFVGMILIYAIIYFWGANEPEEKQLIASLKNRINKLLIHRVQIL